MYCNKCFVCSCVILFVLGGIGCSGVYEGLNSTYINKCYRLPYPERQRCLDDVEPSYERYELERQKTLNSDRPLDGEEELENSPARIF